MASVIVFAMPSGVAIVVVMGMLGIVMEVVIIIIFKNYYVKKEKKDNKKHALFEVVTWLVLLAWPVALLLFVWSCLKLLFIYLYKCILCLDPVCILNLYCYLPILAIPLNSFISLVSGILGCDCDIKCHTDIVLIFYMTVLNI